MSDSPEERAKATVKQADEMIAEVNRLLEEGESTLKKMGLNPEKVRNYARNSASAEDRKKAEAQVRQDLADVDAEVQQAKAYSGGSDSGGKPKRPRSMV
jgi:hypothetical protein